MDEDLFCQQDKIKEDILHQTENFFVKVGIGIVTPGHVMIISKKHFPSFADLPETLNQELEQLKAQLKEKITSLFAAPFLIEYGNCGSIVHAHIHFIPKKGESYEIQDIMEEMIYSKNTPKSTVIKGNSKLCQSGDNYVNIEDNHSSYIITGTTTEEWWDNTDYRKFFSQEIGLKGVVSWSSLTAEEKVLDEQKRKITRKLLVF